MAQAVADSHAQKVIGIGSYINKGTNQNCSAFSSILNTTTASNTTVSKEEKQTDKLSELISDLKKMASKVTICGSCGAMYMGESATICVKCGNDMSAQVQNTTGPDSIS